jgi:hypothetical protein
MALGTEHYLKLGNFFNQILAQYNYHVAPIAPAGKPGKIVKTVRDYIVFYFASIVVAERLKLSEM